MTRDWKHITKKIYGVDEGEVLLSNPSYDLTELPEGAVVHRFESPRLTATSSGIPLKELRSFLWKHRKDRAVTRDRAVLWKDSDSYGIGVVVTTQTLERLTHGTV